jgi:hypothetical protein
MKQIRLKHILFTLVLSFSLPPAFSQSTHITGKVINEKKEAVERAHVMLRHKGGGKISAFTQTAETGSFELKKDLKGIPPDSLELYVTCIGYAPQTVRMPDNNQPVQIVLTGKNYELKEVVVSPQKILQRSDTITYLVSAFSSAEDRTIGDVLKKIPGVEVLENGEIRYQGQKLNKFYIEGSDMLEGRYGLATNNISHKDVAGVEIMENHQPVKALQDVVFSSSPAMNIKLKEDAKSRWAGTATAGAGIPGLWTAEAFAMRFKPKTQSLNTYKGNNTGKNLFEMNVFSSIGDFIPNANKFMPSYIHVAPSVASDIGSSRSTFNQINNLTSNNLYKVGKDFDLVSELTASFDRRESEYVSQTTYFLGDEQVSIEDKTEHAQSLTKNFSGKINLKSNQKTYYVNNKTTFSYDRSDPFIDVSGSFPNSQTACVENLAVGNDFDILRRTGDKIFTFRSTNEYSSKPQSLEVTKNGRPPVLEHIKLSSFYSNSTLDYSFMIGKIRVQAPIRLLYQYRQIRNELEGETNNLPTHKLKVDITPSVNYQLSSLYLSLESPLFYQTLSLNGLHRFYGVNPRLYANWILSSRLKASSSFSLSTDLPDESLFYYGRILNDYRNLTAGYLDFSTEKSTNFTVNMEYKDVLRLFFTNIEFTLLNRWHKKLSGQDFEEDMILNYYYPGNYTTEMWSVSGSLSKGSDGIKGVVSLFPAFIHSRSSLVRNGITIPFASDSYSLKGRVNSTIGKWDLTYDILYARNIYKMESGREYFSSNRLSESLKATFSPAKSLQMSYTLEHYCNELSANNYKHFFFSDVSLSWLLGDRWETSLFIKNIFNEKRYTYYTENKLASYKHDYKIRPRDMIVNIVYRF